MKEEEIRPKEMLDKLHELARIDAEHFDRTKFYDVNCVSCNSSKKSILCIKNGFKYNLCSSCGSVYCSPRPSKKDLEIFYRDSISSKYWYNDVYPIVEEVRREKIFKTKAKELFDFIKQKEINIQNLCDVGAGNGIFLEELKKINSSLDYFAVEPSETCEKILRSKGFDVLPVSVEKTDKWNNKFDFVVSMEVFEHVLNPSEFLHSIKRLLKKDGFCLITTLQYEGFDILTLGEKSKSIAPPYHLNFLSIDGFERIFKNCGFRNIEIITPGKLDVDIVLNSNFNSEFIRVIQSRGENVINNFQSFLKKNKLSSHIWIFAQA
tara:strand:- start:6089 stop:7051 length:963 start_codon:yes stop_codon:yes gene_type:complete